MIGKIKEVDGEKKIEWIAGRADGQGVPIGCVIPIYGNTAPNSSWLICDGSTFDAETYPALALYLGGNRLPDLRECVLVGAGQSDNDYDASANPNGIHEHDVYNVGEFKDDQLQGHEHIIKSLSGNAGWTGSATIGGNDKNTSGIVSDGTNGTPRIGSTTHGKQVGVNYIIKATSVSAETDHAAILAQTMAYIRDQNELSEWEEISISTNSSNPTVMSYDGFLIIRSPTGSGKQIYLNGVGIARAVHSGYCGTTYEGSTATIPVKKNDEIYYIAGGGDTTPIYVAYYKKRDYSNR